MNLSAADKSLLHTYFASLPVVRAYLFGSVARRENKKESDLDILIEFDHSQPIGMNFFTYQAGLEDLLHKKVDMVSTAGLSEHIKPFIDRDKILIYERSPC